MRLMLFAHLVIACAFVAFRNTRTKVSLWILAGVFLPVLHQYAFIKA